MADRNGTELGVTPPEARGRSWFRLGAFLLLALYAAGLMIVVSRRSAPPPRAPFNASMLRRLRRMRPDIVLLGNSMVYTRFEETRLRSLVPHHRVAVLGVSASKSSVWYLVLKNTIVASETHPRVVLFFRDEELTDTRARALGRNHASLLEPASPEDDPLVEKKLAPPWQQPIAWLIWYRDRELPFQRLHAKAEAPLEAASWFVSTLFWRDAEPKFRRARINELFELGNLRDAQEASEPVLENVPLVFGEVLEGSFLPDIIDLAASTAIPLTFVRVRSRGAAEGAQEPPELHRYMVELERYVRGHGAQYYDMHDATWESIDMYGNGDHIAGRYRAHYMNLFVSHMAAIFQ